MSGSIDKYMTKNRNVYTFDFVKMSDGYYEAEIVTQPNYGNRASDLHSTHRLSSRGGRYKVCFGDPKVMNSLSEVKRWTKEWAEATDAYISTGKLF